MAEVRLALEAMRARFELVLVGERERDLRAAGEEALREIRASEAELSFFRADSALSRLNRDAACDWTRPPERTFRLLQLCRKIYVASGGAFDPAFLSSPAARFDAVEFDAESRAVRFTDSRVLLNLGAIGKGEALDRAAVALREHGVTCALLHGGTSSVLALGAPDGERGWRVGIADVACIMLRDGALGVSGSARTHLHDPRTGAPLAGPPYLAAARAPTAAAADAWSTAYTVSHTLPRDSGIYVCGTVLPEIGKLVCDTV